MHQLDGEYEIEDGPSLDRLIQCKLSLNEKLNKLRELDEEILALIEDEGIESEIEQADQFKERLQLAIIRVEHKISAREQLSIVPPPSSHTTVVSPDTVTVPGSEVTVPSGGAPVSGSDVPVTSSAPVSVTTSDVSRLPITQPKQFLTPVQQLWYPVPQ